MTFEFHRNHYKSPRGPSDSAVNVRMPRSLSSDLNALTLAYEEPKYSILLRIIEEYVDSHQEDVAKGRWRMSHYRSEGWDKESADDVCDPQAEQHRTADGAGACRGRNVVARVAERPRLRRIEEHGPAPACEALRSDAGDGREEGGRNDAGVSDEAHRAGARTRRDRPVRLAFSILSNPTVIPKSAFRECLRPVLNIPSLMLSMMSKEATW